MTRPFTEAELKTFAFYQLRLFIEKVINVEQCKDEWCKRMGREYTND